MRTRSSCIISIILAFFILTLPFPAGAVVDWTNRTETNLGPGPAGSWDDSGVFAPNVIKDGSTFKMWYTGKSSTGTMQIGYATSTDGIAWTKHGANPIISHTAVGTWDGLPVRHVVTSTVLKTGSTYEMWYAGLTDEPDPDGGNPQIGYATSSDGIAWTHHGSPVLTKGPAGDWDAGGVFGPTVIKDHGTYEMWYSAGNQWSGIGFADSLDGITWTKYNNSTTTTSPYVNSDPVIRTGPNGGWNGGRIQLPTVIKEDNKHHMWFSGDSGDPATGYYPQRIGYAYVDVGNDFAWKTYNGNPLLHPGAPSAFDGGGVSFPTVIKDGNTYRMWYTGFGASAGGTPKIGYAESHAYTGDTLSFGKVNVLARYESTRSGLQFHIKVKGRPSPLDITSCTVSGPNGFNLTIGDSSMFNNDGDQFISYFYVITGGVTSSYSGTYTFTIKTNNGLTATTSLDLAVSPITVPDETQLDRYVNAAPGTNVYAGNTTPTLKWKPYSGDNYYYRVQVTDWKQGSAWYTSDYVLGSSKGGDGYLSVTIPAGYLKADTPYKWKVQIADAAPSNLSGGLNRVDTGFYNFYTGTKGAANFLNSVIFQRMDSYINGKSTLMSAGVVNLAPWDIATNGLRVENETGATYYTFAPSSDALTWDLNQAPFMYFKMWNSPDISDTTGLGYKFFVSDGSNNSSLYATYVHTSIAKPQLTRDQMTPRDNAYLQTLTPTLTWKSDGTAYKYRVLIVDWNNLRQVYLSGYLDGSAAGQDMSITVPAGILRESSPYRWFVDIFDSGMNNRLRTEMLSFMTPPATQDPGVIMINPEPADMNTAAPWTLASPNSYSQSGAGDQTLNNLTPGNYTLTWGGVAGWEKPALSAVMQTLGAGSTVTFTGVYQTATGTVTINADPDSLNAPWSITGPNNYNLTGTGDRTLTNMTAGAYTVSWSPVNSWNSPAPAVETKTLAIGGAQTFTGTYAQTPIVQVDPASLDFGSIQVGLTKDLTFTLQNVGTATLVGSMSTAAPFSVTSGGTYSLGVGQSQLVTVRYSPTQSGSQQGAATFAGQMATVSLTGAATGGLPNLPGGVLAWGRNDEGQLGDGVTMGHKTPFQVPGLTDMKAVAGGYQHTLAVKNDGTVWAWGRGESGQLGNGTNVSSTTPVQVANLTNVIAVAGGMFHTLALKNDGTVWAWGQGGSGQLGKGTNTSSNIPVQVINLTNVIAIAAGSNHSLAVKIDGTVWAWGFNGDGQLGNGTNISSNIPVPVLNLTNVIAVAGGGGGYFSLALKNDGTVCAWGWGLNGELGNGTNTSSNVPVSVSNLTGVTAVAAGSFHSLALTSDKTVWAWGVGGRLGDENWNNSNIPVQAVNINTATGVAAGESHSAALLADKTVNAWGGNNDGQLGDGTTLWRNAPVLTQGISDVKAVATGGNHTIALKSDGTVWTWGNNQYGQLGDGLKTASPSPGPVQNLTNVIGLSGGFKHSVALKSDKTVWTFGSNENGQLGNGTNVSSNMPMQVLGLTDIKAVSAGQEHTLALKNDGTVLAWGSGGNGQLGNGSYASSNVPVQVSNLTNVIAIAAGWYHSMALKSDGTVWSWGGNWNGQLGNGTYMSYNIPVQVSNLTDVIIAITAGQNHSIALKNVGTVWAWGSNQYGELGNGTNTSSNVPVQVSNLTGVTAVAGGSQHTLALRNDSTVWAWGIGWSGRLGDGAWTNRNTPVQALNLTNVIAVAGGNWHSMALKSDGTVYTWGSGTWGEIGNGTFLSFGAPVPVLDLVGAAGIAACGHHSLAIGSQIGMGAVTIDPNPNTVNASWTLTGPTGVVTNGTGDLSIGVSLAGNYTLTWGDVAGYRTPVSETKAVAVGGTTTFTGAYQAIVGTIVLNPEPNGANAPWLLIGPLSYFRSGSGDMTLADMIVGSYTLYWNGVPGYERPSPAIAVQALAEGQTLTFTGTYQTPTGTVTITPEPGTVNAPWTLYGPYNYSQTGVGSASFTARQSGSYTLTWGDVTGWTKPWPAMQSMMMVPGGTITFNGIYQPAGTMDAWDSRTVGTDHLIGVAYSPDLDLFAAVGWGGTILTSPDGATWTPRTSGTTNTLEKIAYGLSKYVAVGAGGTILTSTDGLNWQPRPSGTTSTLYGVTYGNNLFVAVGQNGVILTSTDGETWTLQSSGTPRHLYGVGYGNGLYVAVGMESLIFTSPNGITWTRQNSGIPNALWRVTYGNGAFLAIGGSGAAMTSPDGIAWKYNTSNASFNGLAFLNGLFTAVGPGGIIATSPDGVRWQGHASGVTTELEDLAYGKGLLVVVGRSGAILFTASRGSVLVEVTPDQIHAPWSLAGPGGYSTTGLGDQALMVASVGDYTLTWGDVSGWRKPTPVQVTRPLSEGGALTFQGDYYQISIGTVVINAEPTGVNATAPWTLTGPNSYNHSGTGDTTLPDLDSGSYTIAWGDVPGWLKPTPSQVTRNLSKDETLTFQGSYYQVSSGTVVINAEPAGVNATAPWTLTGPKSYSRSGAGDTTLIDLDSGSYTLTWGDVTGWTKPSPAVSTQTLNADSTITFAGTYQVTEAVTAPTVTGPTGGTPGQTYSYTASGSASSLGHAVEYQFDWKGDGTDLSAWGAPTQSKTWTQSGNYSVKARARCITHQEIVSAWSTDLPVAINASTAVRNMPGYYGPGYPILVQITMTPDTAVQVYAAEDTPPVGWTVSEISDSGSWDTVNKKVKWGPFFDHNVRTLTYKATPPVSETGKKTFAGSGSFDGVTIPITGSTEVDKGTFHPADTTLDYRIGISECTSYGFAWKTGATWSLEPNPIPIGHMTNACYLWKIGEVYHFDPNTTPPYVTGEGTSKTSVQGANSSVKNADKSGDRRSSVSITTLSQSRRLLTGTLQGSKNTGQVSGRADNNTGWYGIKVEVAPVKGVQGYAVEETLPVGTEVQGINNSGNWDRTNGKVKWGPFLDNMPRTFQYQIRDAGTSVSLSGSSPASSAGSRTNAGRVSRSATFPSSLFSIKGVASLDGVDVTTVNTGSLAKGAGDDRNVVYPAIWMDFDGDGRSDLTGLWEGTIRVALMSGEQELEGRQYPLPSSHKILGYGDWDGDGRADILLGDDSGNIRAWLMEGTKVREDRMIAALPAGAKPLGIGDVNGDGIDDLLWRDAQGIIRAEVSAVSPESPNAEDKADTMDGTDGVDKIDALSISRSSVTLGWMDSRSEVLSFGDYDGDGKTEILWRDGNGAFLISLMEGSGLRTIQVPVVAPSQIMPIGTGDMNGNGMTDILWRDASGSLQAWMMNDANQPGLVQIGQPTPGWEVIGVGDYDGDGIADILWRYIPTGEKRITTIDALTGRVN